MIHIEVNGRIEHLDERGELAKVVDAASYRREYEAFCGRAG